MKRHLDKLLLIALLLLTAIAVQLIVVGLGESFPAWLEPNSPIVDDVQQSSDMQDAAEEGH